MHNSCQFPREIIILYQQNSKKTCVCAYFPGARSNRSNPISYSFYLIGLLWSGDLRETSKLQNTVSFGSPLSLPKMENIGRAQPALQCCTLHSLERDHIHLWSNIESKVQNELKTHGFLHILAQKCKIFCQFPREITILYQQNSKNHVFLHIFQGLVQIEAILSFGPWKTNCFYLNGTWGVCNVHFK